jgi:hypothetical protein
MRLERLLCTIVMALGSAVVNGSQAESPTALPERLRAHVKNEQLQVVTSLRGLPLGVRAALGKLFGGYTLDIAEPGEKFQATGAPPTSTVPIRQLVVAGCSYDHCLVYYEHAGSAHAWRVALFEWTPETTRFESGGAAPGGLKTVDAVRAAVLSGAIKSSNGAW